MEYDREHEGNPAKVHKILKRLENGETTDEIFGTHHRTDQLIEDLMDGSAYTIPDPQERERIRDAKEQAELKEQLKKFEAEHADKIHRT